MAVEQRERIAQDWWFRHHAEQEAALRFERLVDALAKLNAADVVQTMARQAVEDEQRHAVLCADVARQYCADDPYAEVKASAHPIAPKTLDPRSQVLYEMVAMCCVTESINAALLTEILRVSTDPIIRETTHTILKDEVQHARMGWAHLAAEVQQGVDCSFLGGWLVPMLRDSVSETLIDEDANCAQEHLDAHGFLSQDHRRAIFCQTVETVVLPGLARYGVETDAASAWMRAQPFY